MYELRDYQKELYNSLREALKVSKRIISVACMRYGKTVLFSFLAKCYDDFSKDKCNEEKFPVMILTHREELFRQTFEKVISFGVNAGQIRSGVGITKNNITIAMIGTVVSKLKKQEKLRKSQNNENITIITPPKIIIIDECHHTSSASWTWAINHFPDATIIGFTGTPVRLDNKPLYPMFDKMIEGRSMKWMIENYWITPYKHLCPPSPIEEMKIKMKGKDYDTDSQTKEFCTRTVAADVLKYYKQYLNGLQTICFCCDLKHAEYYKEFFDENNYKSQIIHAGSKNRKQIMEDYKSGKYPILISIDILSEGVDVPCCYGILSLRKTASLSLYLQQFSRPLTPSYADGYDIEIKSERKKAMEAVKPFGVILDFVGNVFQHGKVDDEREWTLHPEKKYKKKKKTTIEKKQCPECQFYLPGSAKTCEVCGHDFEQDIKIQKQLKIEQLAGELVNVHDLIPDEALSLSKTIERIKAQQNPIKPLYAILHKSVEHGEGNMRKKVSAMCKGLGYTDKFSHVVWARLRKVHGEKLDKLA